MPLGSTGYENADALQKKTAVLLGDFVWNDSCIFVSIGISCKAVHNVSSIHSVWKSDLNLLSYPRIIQCSKYFSIVKFKKYCREPLTGLLLCELATRHSKNSSCLIPTVNWVDSWSMQEQVITCNLPAVRAKCIVTTWASDVHPRVIAHQIIHVAICPLMKGREHRLIKMN